LITACVAAVKRTANHTSPHSNQLQIDLFFFEKVHLGYL
jgi:hypothetical protein